MAEYRPYIYNVSANECHENLFLNDRVQPIFCKDTFSSLRNSFLMVKKT